MYPPNLKNVRILDTSLLETMKNSLSIINFDGKLDPLWHPYDEVFTDLNSPIIMEIEKIVYPLRKRLKIT